MAVFREDVAALVPALRTFARALTSGDPALADDLVQDTMVNALQARDQYRPGTNLEAWLFTILRNRYRSLRSRRHMSAEIGTDDLEPLASVPAAQEHALEVIAFRRAFARLPRSQREMLVLVTVRGLPYEAAAQICGCEVGTAKSRVHRARAALRAMLLDEAPPHRSDRQLHDMLQPTAGRHDGLGRPAIRTERIPRVMPPRTGTVPPA